MGASKTDQYSHRQLVFAQTAKAIGHPARVAIMQYLSEVGFATNLQVIAITELSAPTVCQHLKELAEAGIIEGIFVGHQHYYTLTKQANQTVQDLQAIFNGQTG